MNLYGNSSNNLFSGSQGNNLFSRNQNMGGGGNMFNGQGNNTRNAGNQSNNPWNRSPNMGNNMFQSGNQGGNNMGGGGNNMFNSGGGNNSNNLFQRSNSYGNNNSGNNQMGNNQYGNHNYNTRSGNANTSNFQFSSYNSLGTVNIKFQPIKGKENFLTYCINAMPQAKNKSLEELRTEDYCLIKQGQIPDNIKQQIYSNMQQANGMGMGMGGGGNNMFQSNQGGMGGNNNMGSNNLFGGGGGGGGGLTLQRGNTIVPSNNQGGGNLFGNNSGNNNMGGGGGGNNNLFNSGGNQGGGGNLFNRGGGGNNMFGNNQGNSGNMGGGGGNNLFGNNSNNQVGQNRSNLFSGGGGGGNMGGGNQQGSNLFSGQNRGGGGGNQLFPQQQGGQNNQLFPNQNQNPNLFPNQNQNNQLFPNQNPQLFPNQYGQMYPQQYPYGYAGYQQYPPYPVQGYPQGYPPYGYPPYPYPQDPHHMYSPNMQGGYRMDPNNPQFNYDKFQNSVYTPYNQDKKESYVPRQSLSEVAMKLTNRFSGDVKESQSYLPYNPFEKKNGKFDKKDNERTNNFMRGYSTFSLIRKTEDRVTQNFYAEDDLETFLRKKPLNSFKLNARRRSNSPISRNSNSFDASFSTVNNKKSIYDNTIKVFVDSNVGPRKEVNLTRSSTIKDLMTKYFEDLYEDKAPKKNAVEIENIVLAGQLSFEATIIEKDRTLEDAGIYNNSYVFVAADDPDLDLVPLHRERSSASNNMLISICEPRDTPLLTRTEYFTRPPFDKIRRLGNRELEEVEGFAIGNEHGFIEFEGLTDIRGVNLDELVLIKPGLAEVYPEAQYQTEESKPQRGTKLNKPAIITLYNCKTNKDPVSAKKQMKKYAEKMGFEFIDYEAKTGTYTLKVEHFTKYGFPGDEMDEEETIQPSPHFPIQKPALQPGVMPSDFDLNKSETSKGFHKPQQKISSHAVVFNRALDQISEEGKDGELSSEQPFEGDMIPESSEVTESQTTLFRQHYMAGRKMMRTNEQEMVPVSGIEEEALLQEDMLSSSLESPTKIIPMEPGLIAMLEAAQNFSASKRKRYVPESKFLKANQNPQTQEILNKIALNNRAMYRNEGGTETGKKEFYMHRSFRVGFSGNGIAIPTKNYTVDSYKVIIHSDLGRSQNDATFNHKLYRKNLQDVSQNMYLPFLRALMPDAIERQMSEMTITESRELKKDVVFPDRDSLIIAIASYVEAFESNKNRDQGDAIKVSFMREFFFRDLECYGLLNACFGNHEVDIWALGPNCEQNDRMLDLETLFNQMKNYREDVTYKRKRAISHWMEKKICMLAGMDLEKFQSDLHSDEFITQRLLIYLTSRQIKMACDYAQQLNFPRLATMISTASANQFNRETLKHQIDEWEQMNDLEYMSFKRVYQFLAGDTKVIELYDWYRNFSVNMWFIAKANTPVSEIFNDIYRNADTDNTLYSPIKSVYADERNKKNRHEKQLMGKIYELSFLLMAIYSNNPKFSNYWECLNTYTYTEDPFDAKFVWLINQYLMKNTTKSNAKGSNDPKLKAFSYRILRDFCYQLELLGLWEYAIYAIVVSAEGLLTDSQKTAMIKNLVWKHYSTSNESAHRHQNDESARVLSSLGVPLNILHQAVAFREIESGNYRKAAKHLKDSKCWDLAHKYLMNVAAPGLYCSVLANNKENQYEELIEGLIEHLSEIERKKNYVFGWEANGGVMLRVLRVIKNDIATQSIESQNSKCEEIIRVLQSLDSMHKDSSDDCKKIMINTIRKELLNLMLQEMRAEVLRIHKDRIASCIEKLKPEYIDDSTIISVSFVNKMVALGE